MLLYELPFTINYETLALWIVEMPRHTFLLKVFLSFLCDHLAIHHSRLGQKPYFFDSVWLF